ncbi:MAG: hypothetical protein D6708_17225 [Candidatus Dadabacteria bacterium]|nr:MAG: hypothetical protein D6708_17225 [Candidatus Dadabacteria bacterium]
MTYTPGSSTGTDTITVTDAAGVCLPAQATVTVIGACSTTVSPSAVTVPVTQSQVFTASSPGGGPYTWSFLANTSGATLSSTTGDTVTYTAGATGGGLDRIQVTDAAGCTAAEAAVSVDSCFIKIDPTEWDGSSCTADATSTVDAGGIVCLTVTGGDGELHWYTDDPDGAFSFDGGTTWEAGTETSPTVSYNFSGDTVLYRAGTTLDTFTVTAKDTEDCKGNQVLSTCDLSFDPHAGTIYETQSLDVSVSNPTATPVSFTASAGTVSATSDTEATFTPSGAGNVVLTAEDAVGCTAATSVAVTACPAITVAASPADSPLKVYETYTLSASGGTGPYTWKLKAGSGTLSGNEFTPNKPGDTVEITVTDANGCTGTWGGTVGCPSGTAIDGETTETGSSISVLEVGLAESCFTSTPEFKLKIKGDKIDWKFEVTQDSGKYKVKAENKDTEKKCVDSDLSLSDLVRLGILDVDTGLDLLGYKKAKDCSLAKALSANGGDSFKITVNKGSKYKNCSTPTDTCGGWYRYAP